jgi:hypothetical protein
MRARYSIATPADVALAAATAKTVLGVRAPASFGLSLDKWSLSFNGVTASAIPVLVELCSWSSATTGTSTAATAAQTAGRAIVHGTTGGYNFTVEPTVLAVLKTYLLTPNGGLIIEEFAPDAGYDNDVSAGFAIRCTAAAIVSLRAVLEFSRC